MNSLLPPVPQEANYKYGGNPNQEAALRSIASNNAQISRNQALMGGKIKRRKRGRSKKRS